MDYGCGPSRAPVAVRCEVNEDYKDCEDKAGDDESDGNGDVQADGHVLSFLTINQLMENVQGRYLYLDVPSCDVSNKPNLEDSDKRGTVNYYLAPLP